ncbi:MAG: NAD-dependent epimerase/dehydratase family protein [Chthoniobacterales bacterium]
MQKARTVLVTGSAGLIGSETVRHFAKEGYAVVGIDNDMRQRFFGAEASTQKSRDELIAGVPGYEHREIDVRDASAVNETFAQHGRALAAIVHTAAQPSHDWAARDPQMDFTVNANGTLNLLEAARNFCPETPFVFTSTNKVYGDTPNHLPLHELPLRWEIEPSHEYEPGISESMSIDQTKHSLFGASKVAADVLVQEYGRYFGMPTACLRGGCLTGPAHAGTELHGFLSYLMKCTVTGRRYRVFGYKRKQVRDNIHSFDLVEAFAAFVRQPRVGEVYNMGGSRHSNCSMLEAIELCEEISGRKLSWEYVEENRVGDHIWWISDVRKFREHYPEWNFRYGLREILEEIHSAVV